MSAQTDWLCPCEYRQELSISENDNSTLTDHQIRMSLPHQTGMNNDFSDLRFTNDDGVTVLDHWVEYFVNGSEAVVWLELDQLTANATETFYLYFGSCGSDISDPNATMVFYDDMDSFSGWNNIGSNSIQASTFGGETTLVKQANCDPSGGWKSIGTTISSFKLITREIRPDGQGASCRWNRYGIENGSYNGYTIRRQAYTNGNANFGYERRTNASASNVNNSSMSQPDGNWYNTELSKCGNNMEAILRDDNMSEIGSVSGTDSAHNSFDRLTVRGGLPYHIDYMAVGKKVCNEPSISFGDIADCPDAKLSDVVHDYCHDGSGSVVVTASEGTPPYSVYWTPAIGSPTQPGIIATDGGSFMITDIPAGTTLDIEVIDSNGCQF